MNKLKKYLTDNNIKPCVFARKANLSHTTIIRFLNNNYRLGSNAAAKIVVASESTLTLEDLIDLPQDQDKAV